MNTPKITAKNVLNLLAKKHSKDVFVSECKSGSTHNGNHLRMDAWSMPRSWAHPDVTAYEVKVSRSDFLQDNKWPAYLDYCNIFYFATAPKIIDPGELPDGVGLIECTRNGGRLFTKRKAARRDVQIPEDIFRYVLMARATITPANLNTFDTREHWRKWLRERESDRTLGWEIKGKIREIYAENVEKVDRENWDLKNRLAGLEKAEAILAEMGIHDVGQWRIDERIAEARNGASRKIKVLAEDMRRQLDLLVGELDT